jgi:hypothetical protein
MVVVLTGGTGKTIRYPRRFLKTRRQLAWQCVVTALVLLPPLVSRFMTERVEVSFALAGLALVSIVLAWRGLRFLARQEQLHDQATPEMTHVFMLVATYPLAISVFLLILLAEI